MIEYKILIQRKAEHLEQFVNTMIGHGFKPIGGVAVKKGHKTANLFDFGKFENDEYSQAMVREVDGPKV